ncbi:MAG TPA: LysR family transcriptional regulator [Candidatus Hydrogenedentes bacterium]|nr:LysR family transcriptional regulator [Candidatus Hydrogenedentota bacterium]HPG67171.1 LysR family transcriptional regulator [Candidatus Hydrogenedentota bacterium]
MDGVETVVRIDFRVGKSHTDAMERKEKNEAGVEPHGTSLKPACRLWLTGPEDEGGLGDGKWRLLQAIAREGSLTAACETLGISYRKAWGDLRKAERLLGVRLLDKRRGGRDGGETLLTEEGAKWIAVYGRFRAQVMAAVTKAFDEHIAPLSRQKAPSASRTSDPPAMRSPQRARDQGG